MLVDRDLVGELETSAARQGLQLAAAFGGDAAGQPFHGGALVALGRGRYVNRAIGVTLEELSPGDLAEIERFYGARGLAPAIEVSSWAPPATLELLAARRYVTLWFRSVFAADPADVTAAATPGIVLHVVDPARQADAQRVLARGSEIDDPEERAISDEYVAAARTMPGTTGLLAEIEGEQAGCGSLHMIGAIGWVGAAATLPEFRGRGVQSTLLAHRLALARELGARLVAGTALPAGTSARNLSRLGFHLVYTQAVLARTTT